MSETKKFPTKLVVGGIAIVAVLTALYIFVFSGGQSAGTDSTLLVSTSTETGNTVTGSDGVTAVDTDRILRQLNDLRRIRINTDLFNSQAFLSLVDFSITINPQPIGRDNPFLPSTYTPTGPSIVPRENPAIPQPLDGSGVESDDSSEVETSASDSSTTTATSSTPEEETGGN